MIYDKIITMAKVEHKVSGIICITIIIFIFCIRSYGLLMKFFSVNEEWVALNGINYTSRTAII